MMSRILLSFGLTLAVIYIVPFLVYSVFTLLTELKPPENISPGRFLLSILVAKVGVSASFVLLFYFARDSFSGKWVLYASLWVIAACLQEVGQAIGPGYTWKEAWAGMISEVVYFPASAFLVNWLLAADVS